MIYTWNQEVRQTMGMIADELEHTLTGLHAILLANPPIVIHGNTLMCPAGPVSGVAISHAEPIYAQMGEIAKAMQGLPKAIRKLEDRLKKLEDVPQARSLPQIPQGFRK